jgi:hypothetical protein
MGDNMNNFLLAAYLSDIMLLRIISGVLLLVPIVLSIIHKKWLPTLIFVTGYLFFGFVFFKPWESMEDLGAVANLVVIVLPLYIIGFVAWFISYRLKKKKQ